jgi:DNA-binding transcriptional MerR regulator
LKTTTSKDGWPFTFTVTDLARFLGKSPVTIRGWEARGIVSIPRNHGGDRQLTLSDLRAVARKARELGRITETRLKLVEASVTMLELIERENRPA